MHDTGRVLLATAAAVAGALTGLAWALVRTRRVPRRREAWPGSVLVTGLGAPRPDRPLVEHALATLGSEFLVLREPHVFHLGAVDYLVIGSSGVFVIDARAERPSPGSGMDWLVETAGYAVVTASRQLRERIGAQAVWPLVVDPRHHGPAREDWVEVGGDDRAWRRERFRIGSPEALVTAIRQAPPLPGEEASRFVAHALARLATRRAPTR